MNNKELMQKLLERLEKTISKKPTWGKNEVMKAVTTVFLEVSLEAMDQ